MREDPMLERLSALADGELPRAEASLLLARLVREPALKRAWERYHLTSEAMRHGLAPACGRDFAAGVQARLAAEVAPPRAVHLSARLARPLAGAALAAGVAALAILGLRAQAPHSDGVTVPMLAGTDPLTVEGAALGVARVEFDPAAAELEARLNSYLLDHASASGVRVQGVAPYVRGAVVATVRSAPAPSTPAESTSPASAEAPAARATAERPRP